MEHPLHVSMNFPILAPASRGSPVNFHGAEKRNTPPDADGQHCLLRYTTKVRCTFVDSGRKMAFSDFMSSACVPDLSQARTKLLMERPTNVDSSGSGRR